MGPVGEIPLRVNDINGVPQNLFTVTPVAPRSGTVVVGGVSQPGTLARTFSIGFPTQMLSGTYSFVSGRTSAIPISTPTTLPTLWAIKSTPTSTPG